MYRRGKRTRMSIGNSTKNGRSHLPSSDALKKRISQCRSSNRNCTISIDVEYLSERAEKKYQNNA